MLICEGVAENRLKQSKAVRSSAIAGVEEASDTAMRAALDRAAAPSFRDDRSWILEHGVEH